MEERYKAEKAVGSLSQEGQEHRFTGSRGIGYLALALGQHTNSSARVAGTVRILSFSIILAVGVFFSATIREGHVWGDDFSLYILHARNIAEGINYQQTGYIYNPTWAMVGPYTYPPVFPLLLSPIYKFSGLNLTVMKMEIVVIFLLSLITLFLAFRKYLPWPYLVALLAITGFNPYIWQFKDNIVSDLPFLLLVYFGLFLINRVYEADRPGRWLTFDALLISFTIYLAYGARSMGLVLLLCLLAYDLIKNRRPTAFAIKVAVLTGAFVTLQSVFLHSERAYADSLEISLSAAISHTWEYASELSGLLAGESHKALRLALFVATSGLALIGYFTRIRQQITYFELFPVLYLIPLLVLTMPADARYLLPIMPLYLFYVFLGIQAVSRNKERESLVFLTMLLVILATYAAQYARLDYGPIREGIGKNETQQLFDYVRKETSETDVFVFRKPRAFALFTGRKAAALHRDPDDQALWKYLRQIKATYLVLGPKQLEPDDQEFVYGFIARHQNRLQETYINDDFRVYRIREPL